VRSLKRFGVTAVIATVVTLLAASCTSPNTLKPGVDGDAATTVLGPATTGAASTTVDVNPPEPFRQFRSISVRITLADGTTRELCLLLADTDERRSRGLMEVTDLAGYSGMVFSWGGEAVSSAFYMYKTKLPLSIAYFGADGAFLGSNDMLPASPRTPRTARSTRRRLRSPRRSRCRWASCRRWASDRVPPSPTWGWAADPCEA
jgi:uncharacterized membrane protein (UPF0127 family)